MSNEQRTQETQGSISPPVLPVNYIPREPLDAITIDKSSLTVLLRDVWEAAGHKVLFVSALIIASTMFLSAMTSVGNRTSIWGIGPAYITAIFAICAALSGCFAARSGWFLLCSLRKRLPLSPDGFADRECRKL